MPLPRRRDEANTLQFRPLAGGEIVCPRIVVVVLAISATETIVKLVRGRYCGGELYAHDDPILKCYARMASSLCWSLRGYRIAQFPCCSCSDCDNFW